MNCPKCGFDRLKVDRTYRGVDADSRVVRCLCCAAEFIEESRILGAYKRNPDSDSFYPRERAELSASLVHLVILPKKG